MGPQHRPQVRRPLGRGVVFQEGQEGEDGHPLPAAQPGDRPARPAQVGHHVKHHTVIAGVTAVAVGFPVLQVDVDLHIAPYQPDPLLLKQGVPKVGPRCGTGPPGIDDAEAPPVRATASGAGSRVFGEAWPASRPSRNISSFHYATAGPRRQRSSLTVSQCQMYAPTSTARASLGPTPGPVRGGTAWTRSGHCQPRECWAPATPRPPLSGPWSGSPTSSPPMPAPPTAAPTPWPRASATSPRPP